ncbi:DUF3892 domain-containing protein [Methanobrevibacter sp. DSM 116169]|uniref:DUF3892 domain-containing protein n=1 Tax=Methanobrevibacter sp. DSM 116169 TaxID=3242727 RepID=UPI0038FD330C
MFSELYFDIILNNNYNLTIGAKVIKVKINGGKFIKTKNNNIAQDNLENLPRF